MPRYLVSGAAGFIGSNLVLTLQAEGAEVVAVDSFRTGARANLAGFQGECLQSDVAEGGTIPPGPYDAVFHLGDITDPRHGDDAEVLRKNVAGFTRMLSIARASQCRLVYASTAGLYGNGPTPMREDQPLQVLTAYGESKRQMDALGAEASREIPVIGLRYFNVYGPREGAKGRAASMVFHLYHQIKKGSRPRLFEWGEQKRDFVYVKDCVAANLCALRAPSGVYNVGSGVAATFNEMAACVGRAMQREQAPEYFASPYQDASYQNNTHSDTRLAAERLGFKARWSLYDGILDYVKWLDSQS